MKRYILFLALFITFFTYAKPYVFLDYKVFYKPDGSPYVETILHFAGGSLKYKANKEGKLEANIEIVQMLKKNDNILIADKYIITSIEQADSVVDDFFDIKRYAIESGIYDFEITITDLNNNEFVSAEQSFLIPKFSDEKINFSSFLLIQNAQKTDKKSDFARNGYIMLPYLTNYYPPSNDKIAFYFELYNTNKKLGNDEKFMVTFQVEESKSQKAYDKLFKVQKYTTSEIVPILTFLPIDELPTGDYNIVISVINKDNETVNSNVIFFQRRNNIEVPEMNLENIDLAMSFTKDVYYDSIPYYLNSLMPISQRNEYETIRGLLKTRDTVAMQKYFHAYWVQTSPANPYEAWVKYKNTVNYVQEIYGTQIKKGFETDRGRIYLQYGTPNFVTERPNEPSAYPYEIWHYYRVGRFSNVRFVFYNPDLITNDYSLLHCDMPGEVNNYRWQHELHKRNSPFLNIDDPLDGNNDHFGGNSGIYINN